MLRLSSTIYVPYTGDKPAMVSINGHNLVIAAEESQTLLRDLQTVGGDSVRKINDQNMDALTSLAASVRGGIVIAPKEISLPTMIKNLEAQLPWLH